MEKSKGKTCVRKNNYSLQDHLEPLEATLENKGDLEPAKFYTDERREAARVRPGPRLCGEPFNSIISARAPRPRNLAS